jgi:hypothetical protein
MGLLQTGSKFFDPSTGLFSSGLTEKVYGCDGCKQKTGDRYARLAFVFRDSGEDEWDESEIQGWTFIEDECYCPTCSGNEDVAPRSDFFVVPPSALRPMDEFFPVIMDAERKDPPGA